MILCARMYAGYVQAGECASIKETIWLRCENKIVVMMMLNKKYSKSVKSTRIMHWHVQ
jgi:hypothetical protein